MTIRVKRFPEHRVNLHIYSGTITAEQVSRHFAGLEATRWVGYFDPTADISTLDVASLPKLRQALSDKQRELFGDHPPPCAIVHSSRPVEKFFRFWRRYAIGEERPIIIVLFASLEGACGWLGLPDAACRAFMATAEVDPPAATGRTLETGGGADRRR